MPFGKTLIIAITLLFAKADGIILGENPSLFEIYDKIENNARALFFQHKDYPIMDAHLERGRRIINEILYYLFCEKNGIVEWPVLIDDTLTGGSVENLNIGKCEKLPKTENDAFLEGSEENDTEKDFSDVEDADDLENLEDPIEIALESPIDDVDIFEEQDRTIEDEVVINESTNYELSDDDDSDELPDDGSYDESYNDGNNGDELTDDDDNDQNYDNGNDNDELLDDSGREGGYDNEGSNDELSNDGSFNNESNGDELTDDDDNDQNYDNGNDNDELLDDSGREGGYDNEGSNDELSNDGSNDENYDDGSNSDELSGNGGDDDESFSGGNSSDDELSGDNNNDENSSSDNDSLNNHEIEDDNSSEKLEANDTQENFLNIKDVNDEEKLESSEDFPKENLESSTQTNSIGAFKEQNHTIVAGTIDDESAAYLPEENEVATNRSASVKLPAIESSEENTSIPLSEEVEVVADKDISAESSGKSTDIVPHKSSKVTNAPILADPPSRDGYARTADGRRLSIGDF